MEYNAYLENCGNGDVVSFGSDELYKVTKLKSAFESAKGRVADVIIESFESQGIKGTHIYGNRHKANYEWLREGKDSEILRVGAKGWQKGKLKIKISLEFCPNEPELEEVLISNQSESSLDDIRKIITNNKK